MLPFLDNDSFEGLIKKREEVRELKVVDDLEKLHRKDLERVKSEGSVMMHLRNIQENILNLRCPRCQLVFHSFDGCFALKCRNCSAAFCAWCLQNCGGNAHQHVANCKYRRSKDPLYGSILEFQECHRKRKARLVAHYLKKIPLPAEMMKLLHEKLRPHISDLDLK